MNQMDSIYADMTNLEKQVADYLRELDLWWSMNFLFSYMMRRKDPEYGPLTFTFQN